jgi:hypothetical protein
VRAKRIERVAALVPLMALLLGVAAASGGAQRLAATTMRLRVVAYHGYSVTVPRSWPVYSLAKEPQTCVRFNRHAVYLGLPGTAQQCPARAVGRTEAILIEPTGATAAREASGRLAADPVAGQATTFTDASAGVEVTATWLREPSVIAAAVHRAHLRPSGTSSPTTAQSRARIASSGPHASSDVYTGPGFDVCHAPSPQHMSAWASSSPYHAIGLYIGGANAACPPATDPNLTTAWISSEVAAGWHLIPTYVGLQAPSNSCGCTGISTNASQASTEGTAAAQDAATQAQALGLPAGNPIYDDIEFYSRTQANTSAVLAFLAAWTSQLHAEGYLSGVYGNANSAIADLVTQYGTGYQEPDDIWFAAWPGSGSQSTSDPNIPSADWTNHQRLHQYVGGHNETYGGVTINIDGDYLDAATANTVGGAAVPPPSAPPPPALTVDPTPTGMTNLTASWGGQGLASWEVVAGTNPSALSAVASALPQGGQTQIAVQSAAPYFAVQALGTSNQLLAVSPTVASPAHLQLFGRSSFVGQKSGVGTIPVGCYLTTACHIVATLSSGRTTVARTTTQGISAGGTGLLYYRLTTQGSRLLARARGARLPALVTLRDASGKVAVGNLTMIPFVTTGAGPARSFTPGAVIGVVGLTDFVWGAWTGGILVRCNAVYPCAGTTATLTAGGATIASSAPSVVGGRELGYVFFSLTGRGHQLLSQSKGNQLGASLVVRDGTSVAQARLVLVRFN